MAVSEANGNTQACSIGTEHTLDTITTAGTYQLGLDLSNLVAGDILEVRVYTKVRAGATSRVAFQAVYPGPRSADDMNAYTPPLMIHTEVKYTIKQTAGTGRNVVWSIAKA